MRKMAPQNNRVTILGVFVADLAFRAGRLPNIGETISGSGFAMGPGGKGSNQAVAAARAGADVTFISALGDDEFGATALDTWAREGITAKVEKRTDLPTGAAFIFVNDTNGDNAIIIVPGAADSISVAQVETQAETIAASSVFVTQLEQPVKAALRGLQIARAAGVTTLFNPAPAEPVEDTIFALCDFVTPNEHEAALLTGVPVTTPDDAKKAGDAFLAKGVGTAIITLGEAGALFHSKEHSVLVPAFNAGPVLDTTGAGDAFNGGFAAAIARGQSPFDATRFGAATAGLAVTKPGTAPAMPQRAEIEALLTR
jgi:ribokinase